MQQRVIRSLLLPLVAGSLFVAGCSDTEQAQAGPGGAQPTPTVGVVTLQAQTIPVTTTLPGRAQAFKVAEVRPQVTGIVQAELFEGGSEVEAGQQLYQIDPALFQAEVASTEASLARAEANQRTTQKRFERIRKLLADKSVSQQDFDEAEAAYLQAEADLKVAQANLTRAKLNLQYTRVEAPISGVIGRSHITPGALVSAGQAQALTTITQLSPMYIDIVQNSDQYLQLKTALEQGVMTANANNVIPVTIHIGEQSGLKVQGELLFNEVTVDPQTSSITLRARVANENRTLLPGMFVRAELALGERPNTILAPQEGVSRDPRGRATALVVTADGKVEPRELSVSGTQGANWIVTSGLAAGDRLIVEGLQKVQPGMSVNTEEVN